jgi:hypothetical protein
MMAASFATLAAAMRFATQVNAALGYPRRGTDIGDGEHADAIASETTDYASVLAHPSGSQWAYVADDNTTPLMTTATAATVAELDASWFPVPVLATP